MPIKLALRDNYDLGGGWTGLAFWEREGLALHPGGHSRALVARCVCWQGVTSGNSSERTLGTRGPGLGRGGQSP